MKLLKLTIRSSYKNLSGEYDFSGNDGYIALIGLNGSGKSNLLESIGLVFSKILDPSMSIPQNKMFDYEVVYEINGVTKTFSGRNVREVSKPTNLIACYSGEDSRLWHKVFESYHLNFNAAVKKSFCEPQILYVNKYCWPLALIALLSIDDDAVKKSFLNGTGIESVEVVFRVESRNHEKFKKHDAIKWFDRFYQGQKTFAINLKEMLSYDVLVNGIPRTGVSKGRTLFNFLYVLSQPKKDKSRINKIDKLIQDIEVMIGGIGLRDMSEGEKKMILIECITKILANDNSLVLFDEPDAHVHIARKKELLDAIAKLRGQTVFTTHSPAFLDRNEVNFKEQNVFYVDDGKISSKSFLQKIHDLSGGVVNYFEGAFILRAKKILLVEGKSDRDILTQAIKRNPRYKNLEKVYIYPMYSSSNVNDIYNNVLSNHPFESIVFLFDYDGGGFDGWKTAKGLDKANVVSMFYQKSYQQDFSPRKKENIDNKSAVLIEDLFPPDSYASVIEDLRREFNNRNTFKAIKTGNHLNGEKRIKEFLEENCTKNTFKDEWFSGFNPLLDKLLEVFHLS